MAFVRFDLSCPIQQTEAPAELHLACQRLAGALRDVAGDNASMVCPGRAILPGFSDYMPDAGAI
jgi:hypothetical protein